MLFSINTWGALAVVSYVIYGVLGQDFAGAKGLYTEPNTGITFWLTSMLNAEAALVQEDGTYSVGGYSFGMALPESAVTIDYFDYIGLIIGSLPNGTSGGGWAAALHGNVMNNNLMVVAWPFGDQVITSLRFAEGYTTPTVYNGSATITQLYSNVNDTAYTVVFHCQNCLIFGEPGEAAHNVSTSAGGFEMSWAQSDSPVFDPNDPETSFAEHNNGFGRYKIIPASATQALYSDWATKTAISVTNTATATGVASISSVPVPTGVSYDYIVVGGGAAGIPIADKLSEAGHSVLLIEKGQPSSARWLDDIPTDIQQPTWLTGNLTWFDVPGLCNQIWYGYNGTVACGDTDQMTGCILGGGAAINAGLWWKDVNFPYGWKSADMEAATERTFSRIPGTAHPSMDGELYVQSGYDVVAPGLAAAGWANVTANNVPGQKNRTFAHTPYMSSHGERGGPMATYLVTAKSRSNFDMWLRTTVKKVIRTNGHATSVEVEPYLDGGYAGTVNLTATTGRVILAAGTFGTAKILFRSGIVPTDQLEIVSQSTDGLTMINSTQWIDLPVGYNLDDHLNTDMIISHPNFTYYHWETGFNSPNATDAVNYLSERIGPFSEAAPDIGPMFWEEITGADGIVRQLQYTARVEGNGTTGNINKMTLSQYLGRGQTSRGRTTISQGLSMTVSTIPYGHDPNDIAAVVSSLQNVYNALSAVPGLTFNYPPPNTTIAAYVAELPITYANIGNRRANHWLGTAKIGPDSGLLGGTSVVDLNTKVYGTDNIHIVDASIFPGMPSTNPSGPIVVVAEKASDLILALPLNTAIPQYWQCGGPGYSGSQVCEEGLSCKVVNTWFSQCV